MYGSHSPVHTHTHTHCLFPGTHFLVFGQGRWGPGLSRRPAPGFRPALWLAGSSLFPARAVSTEDSAAGAGAGRGVHGDVTTRRSLPGALAGAAASRDPGSCPGCAPPALTLHLQAPDQPLCRAEPAGRVSAAAPPFWVLLPLLPPSWGRPLCSPFPGPGELPPAVLRGPAGEPGRGKERDLGFALG